MTCSSLVSNFSAAPHVDGLAVILSWEIVEQTDPLEIGIGEDIPELFPDFTGNIILCKHSHGFIKDPSDTRAKILFSGTLPITPATYYFVDNGGNSADYTGYEPVTSLDSWTAIGSGLPGGITYYYSLFLENADGTYTKAPEEIYKSSYAYSRWGHALWLKKRLPAHYWKYDDGTLAGFCNIIGGMFDSIKTDLDRIGNLNDAWLVEEELLPLLAEMLGWPDDPLDDITLRRQLLLDSSTFLQKKGRLDNFLDVIEHTTSYRPILLEDIHYRWCHDQTAFKVIPTAITTEDYDFGTTTGYITSGDGRYIAELGVQPVSVITLPDGDWPPFDGFFNGHKVRTTQDEARIVSYTYSDRKLILDKVLTINTTPDEYIADEFITIIICTPPTSWPFLNSDYRKCLERGTVARKYLAGKDKNAKSITLYIDQNILGENANIAKIVRKINLYKDYLLSGGRSVKCYIREAAFVEE